MRGLLAALLLLRAAPLFAVDTGKADGKVVVNGKTVRFKPDGASVRIRIAFNAEYAK
jgi:hypothetical protein